MGIERRVSRQSTAIIGCHEPRLHAHFNFEDVSWDKVMGKLDLCVSEALALMLLGALQTYFLKRFRCKITSASGFAAEIGR